MHVISGPDHMQASGPGWEASSLLVAGQYPDVEPVIAKTRVKELRCQAADLRSALRRAIILVDAKTSNCVEIKADGNEAVIRAATPTVGEAEVSLAMISDTDMEVSFNPRLLLDGVELYPADCELVIEYADSTSPMLMRSDLDGTPLYVLAPVSVRAAEEVEV